MAAIPVEIRATLFDLQSKSSREVFLSGVAYRSDREIGGGPMPPGGGDPGAHPEHPIFYPPSIWGPPTMPPGFWGGGMGPGVKPQPPGMPTEPPAGGGDKPPPEGAGGWGFYDSRWGYFPAPNEASPKA